MNGLNRNINMSEHDRRDLVGVWYDTISIFNNVPPLKKKEWSDMNDIYDLDDMPFPSNAFNTVMEIKNMDTLDMALDYVKLGLNPVILNMASDQLPGGGVAHGATAQEEEIFRRTNGHLLLPRKWYPLEESDIIYSPKLTIIKKSRESGYELLGHDDATVGMISCAAIRRPILKDGKYDNHDYNLMMAKVDAIVKLGLGYGHDSIVLGAFGCGAYGNPPDQVAQMFKVALGKYKKYYKKIGFAVLTTRPSDNQNFIKFSDMVNGFNKN
jgi:uncharacterized protein (TIGR02452 family)